MDKLIEFFQSSLGFYNAHHAQLFGVILSLLALSEALPFVKNIEANGLVQGLISFMKKNSDQPKN